MLALNYYKHARDYCILSFRRYEKEIADYRANPENYAEESESSESESEDSESESDSDEDSSSDDDSDDSDDSDDDNDDSDDDSDHDSDNGSDADSDDPKTTSKASKPQKVRPSILEDFRDSWPWRAFAFDLEYDLELPVMRSSDSIACLVMNDLCSLSTSVVAVDLVGH